jgi:4-carboxymuconolactone decarboxylase
VSETPEQLRARGLAKMREVYGWDFQDGPGDFFALTADHLFAGIWSRPGLDVAQRRLLLIGMLAGQGRHDVLGIQLDAALRCGDLDAEALREIVVFLSHYAGWSTGATMNTHVEEILGRHTPRDAEQP